MMLTIENYAKLAGVSSVIIRKRVRRGIMKVTHIEGTLRGFIDTKAYPPKKWGPQRAGRPRN
jgi:hypothetical protein